MCLLRDFHFPQRNLISHRGEIAPCQHQIVCLNPQEKLVRPPNSELAITVSRLLFRRSLGSEISPYILHRTSVF